MEKDKSREMVAQVFNLCNLFKSPGGIYPTGRSLEGFISLLGDARHGKFLSPEERTITLEALCHWDNKKWTLYAAVVLPDHVHVLAQPLGRGDGGAFDLGEILHSIKRFSARKSTSQEEFKAPFGKMSAMTG